jgi:UDP-3-O-[3-hydroxymyristoyl] glucosamine N-acyltransferase
VAFTLQELATICGGQLTGDPAIVINGAASLVEATAGEITFFADPRYAALVSKTQASAVLVPAEFTEKISPAQIRVASPAKAFALITARLAPAPIKFAPGVHPTAIVDATAKLGKGVSVQPHAVIEAGTTVGDDTVIGAGCYIGPECMIGSQTLLYPNAVIRERCLIGDRVIIHSGAVIGADGFGFELVEGRFIKVPQTGIVQIDDDAEIGANTTIDRARFGRTWIQRGVKIDNLVQIAHNVVVGEDSAIAAQVGIAGSVRIGKYVLIAGQAGLVGHVEVSDRAIIGAQSGVSKKVGPGPWLLSPAVPLDKAKEQIAWIHRLGKLYARVKAIEQKLGL